MTTAADYTFIGGYPTPETVQRVYDGADLNRAILARRFVSSSDGEKVARHETERETSRRV